MPETAERSSSSATPTRTPMASLKDRGYKPWLDHENPLRR